MLWDKIKSLLTDPIEKWNMKFCVWLQILMKVICTWCSTKIFLEDKIVVFKKKHTSLSCYYLERSRNHITGFRICYWRTVTDGRNVPSEKIFPNTPKTTFSNPDFHGGFEYKLCFYVRFQISSQITLLTDVTDGQIKTLTGDYKLLLSDRPPIFIANIADTPSFK